MKPLIEKLPLSQNSSFVARTYRTPLFEVPWHQHIEYELIWITEGDGKAMIGNSITNYHKGDLFFLGSNLPHTFQKAHDNMIAAGLVVQFRDDFWGEAFLQLPEANAIRQLLERSGKGLRIKGATAASVKPLLGELEKAIGFARIVALCECLQQLAQSEEYDTLSTAEVKPLNPRHKERIDRIFQYTLRNFREAVTVSDVAAEAGLSPTAFCSYFKKSTKKTYVDFLNEIRIGHACQLLLHSNRPVNDICYDSGFNTLANFNKQFLKSKQITPTAFRKLFRKATGTSPVKDVSGRVLHTT
jgi:AraC-like DNA-binding protein